MFDRDTTSRRCTVFQSASLLSQRVNDASKNVLQNRPRKPTDAVVNPYQSSRDSYNGKGREMSHPDQGGRREEDYRRYPGPNTREGIPRRPDEQRPYPDSRAQWYKTFLRPLFSNVHNKLCGHTIS
jgi:hypothetical protein